MSVNSAKPWIKSLGFYEPGRPIAELARELGCQSAADIIKLASNENALGPSPKAVEAMRQAASDMHIYPDGGGFYLRQALAKQLNVEADQIVLGNGSNELIVFLSHVFLGPSDNIVMSECAFVVYKLAAACFEAQTIATPMQDFHHDLDAMLAAITPATKLVYISNPNNPTGTMVDGGATVRFMDAVPEDVLVVFDEAYIELLAPDDQPATLDYVRAGRKACVLRSFSKTYGLAGLRIGYGVAPKEIASLLNRVRQPFNVNAMAQAAALAALEDVEHVCRTRDMVAAGRRYLEDALGKLELEFIPSVTNFMLVKVGAGREVFDELQRRKMIVRPMNGYGLPDYIRVTVGTEEQNRVFIDLLSDLKREGLIEA